MAAVGSSYSAVQAGSYDVQLPAKPMPPWHGLLKQAISDRDKNRAIGLYHHCKHELWNNPQFARPAFQDLLSHACHVQECPLEIKQLLFTSLASNIYGDVNPQEGLEFSVENDEHDFALDYLMAGANPEKLQARHRSDRMRDLLVFAQHRNILYPSDATQDRMYKLDQAFLDWRHEEGIKIFRQEIQGKTTAVAWRDALKDGRVDIQRAVLLCTNDPGFRLEEVPEAQATDPGVRKVMKMKSYFPPKYGMPENMNARNNRMLCTEWVVERTVQAKKNPAGKVELDKDNSRNKPISRLYFQGMIEHALEAHLKFNKDIGAIVSQQLRAIENDNKLRRRVIVIRSIDHAMDFRIRIKDGEMKYVVRFDEPNRTTSHVRSQSHSLKTFEFQDLSFYIESENYARYYREPFGLSLVFVIADEEPTTLKIPNRMLTSSCIQDKDIDGTALIYLMDGGFAGDIRRLKHEIKNRSDKEKIDILSSSSNLAICKGVALGNDDAIDAFGELMDLIPFDRRAGLIPPTLFSPKEGRSDLYVTTSSTIQAVERILEKIPDNPFSPLEIESVKFWHLMRTGDADDISKFRDEIGKWPEDEQMGIMSFMMDDMLPIEVAISYDNHEAIDVFGELMDLFFPDRYDELIPEGLVREVVKNCNNSMVVEAVQRLLKRIPEDAASFRFDRIIDFNESGDPVLTDLLLYGEPGQIVDYGVLLPLLMEEQRVVALCVEDMNGVSNLRYPVREACVDNIEEFMSLLNPDLVPEPQHTNLLDKLASIIVGLLAMELQEDSGYPNIAKGIRPLLRLLSKDRQAQMLIDAAGRPLRICLAKDGENLETVRAFITLVKEIAPGLKEDQRLELLNKIQSSHSTKMKNSNERTNFLYYGLLEKRHSEIYNGIAEIEELLASKS